MALLIKFINLLKANIASELSKKTGWGRNEVSAAIQRAIDRSLQEIV